MSFAHSSEVVRLKRKLEKLEAENVAMKHVLKEIHVRLQIGKAGTSWWLVPRNDWEMAKDLPVIVDVRPFAGEQKG